MFEWPSQQVFRVFRLLRECADAHQRREEQGKLGFHPESLRPSCHAADDNLTSGHSAAVRELISQRVHRRQNLRPHRQSPNHPLLAFHRVLRPRLCFAEQMQITGGKPPKSLAGRGTPVFPSVDRVAELPRGIGFQGREITGAVCVRGRTGSFSIPENSGSGIARISSSPR